MKITRKGQMSLIMLLVIALALIFYAVALNWSKISGYKTQVTIASNTGTAALVSMMGSYANYQIQTTLGGRKEYCNNTGVFAALLKLFVLIAVFVVVVIATGGSGVVAGVQVSTALAISAGLAAAAVVVQVVMQPSITKAISKYLNSLPTQEDQFFEQGIQTALSSAMNDSVEVDDLWDMDMDGRWYRYGAGMHGSKIPRFMYYYTQRLRELYSVMDLTNFKLVQQALKGVMVDLGVYDLTGSTGSACHDAAGNVRPECNVCCQSPEARPSGCSKTFVPSECGDTAALPAPGCDVNHLNLCYVYDPGYGAWPVSQQTTIPPDPPNADRLMNLIGRDDWQWNNIPPTNPPVAPKFLGSESQGGLFSLLWLQHDTQPAYPGSVGDIAAADMMIENMPSCHWCTDQAAPFCDQTDLFHFTPVNDVAYGQLSLVNPCEGDTCCVNVFGNDVLDPASQDSRRIDRVPAIMALASLGDAECSAPNATTGEFDRIWKSGNDTMSPVFIGTDLGTYPYKMGVLPYIPASAVAACADAAVIAAGEQSCACQTVPATNVPLWRDDFLDEISSHLISFVQIASKIVDATSLSRQSTLAKTVKSWGPVLMNEIDFLTDDGYTIQVADGSGGYTSWNINIFKALVERLFAVDGFVQPWLEGKAPDASGSLQFYSLDPDLWCLPPKSALGTTEATYILNSMDPATGQPTQWGSLESVIRCLEYNATNEARFGACAASGACTNLPRSLLPGFDPNDSSDPYYTSNIVLSQQLALNQGIKLAKRAAYLRDIRDRLLVYKDKLQVAYNLMSVVHTLLDASGNPVGLPDGGPSASYLDLAKAYLQKMIDQDATESKLKLGNVVYGWISLKPTTWDSSKPHGDRGYLHLVKVEASMPTRDFAPGMSVGTTKLPWIDTWTEGFLDSKRCYALKDTKGSVGTRVLRYDEDRDPAQGGVLKLLSGVPLWQVSFGNPRSGAACSSDDVIEKCFMTHYVREPNSTNDAWVYREVMIGGSIDGGLMGAFILNPPINPTDQNALGAKACLDSVDLCLQRGVGAETCANYFYDGSKMDIKFRKCR